MTAPALMWALLAGAWIDRYVTARKLLMVMSVGAAIVENCIAVYLTIDWNTSKIDI